ELALRIVDIEGDFVLWRGLEVVINHRTRGRIFSGWLTRINLRWIMQSHGCLRFVQFHVSLCELRVDLAKRGQVVELPKGPAMSSYHKVIILDNQIVNR